MPWGPGMGESVQETRVTCIALVCNATAQSVPRHEVQCPPAYPGAAIRKTPTHAPKRDRLRAHQRLEQQEF